MKLFQTCIDHNMPYVLALMIACAGNIVLQVNTECSFSTQAYAYLLWLYPINILLIWLFLMRRSLNAQKRIRRPQMGAPNSWCDVIYGTVNYAGEIFYIHLSYYVITQLHKKSQCQYVQLEMVLAFDTRFLLKVIDVTLILLFWCNKTSKSFRDTG